MPENKFEIYVFSKDKKEDYHFRPKSLSNKAYEILAKTGFEKLIEGPLAEGRSEAPKCALKHIKEDGIYLYIADLETKRTDNFRRPIVISALIYFKGYDTDALRLFINIILGNNIIEITSFFDAIFEQGVEAAMFEPKIFEDIEGLCKTEADYNCKEKLFEYNRDNVLKLCGIIMNKYINSNIHQDFLLFSGDYLKMTIFDETNPEICLYKNLIENRPENKILSKFLLIIFSLILLLSFLIFYQPNRPINSCDSFPRINISGTVENLLTAEVIVTGSAELKNETTKEVNLNGTRAETESVTTTTKRVTNEVNLNKTN